MSYYDYAEGSNATLAEYKQFHKLLCERFEYMHDEKDWKRDTLSLIEHIARRIKDKDEVIKAYERLCTAYRVGQMMLGKALDTIREYHERYSP